MRDSIQRTEDNPLGMHIRRAQDGKWYVVDYMQRTYGGSFSSREGAEAYMDDDE